MLQFVSCLDEFVYFFVLGVDLFFEFALCLYDMLVGGGEVVASCGDPCDGAAYYYASESEDGRYQFCHVIKSSVGCFDMLSSMSREFIENVVLILLSSFLIGVMVVGGYLLITGLPAFVRFLFIIWYVLIV